jgi:ATP-binding cassette subfamily B protein
LDIRDLNPVDLRQQIAIVPQAPVMFSMSVNVRFGRPNAKREEVIHATKTANAHAFITAAQREI